MSLMREIRPAVPSDDPVVARRFLTVHIAAIYGVPMRALVSWKPRRGRRAA